MLIQASIVFIMYKSGLFVPFLNTPTAPGQAWIRDFNIGEGDKVYSEYVNSLFFGQCFKRNCCLVKSWIHLPRILTLSYDIKLILEVLGWFSESCKLFDDWEDYNWWNLILLAFMDWLGEVIIWYVSAWTVFNFSNKNNWR